MRAISTVRRRRRSRAWRAHPIRRSRRSGTTCSRIFICAAAGRKMPNAKRPRVAGWSRGVRADARLLLTMCCAVGVGCRAAPTTTSQVAALPQHVLIVTIDTLRADHLGCYGYANIATPNMDRLAREGAMALAATVPAPITRPSHISIFTGLYPAQHGIRDNISRALDRDVPTMAEAFKAAGFETAGFVSSIVLSRQSGLARGF